MASPAFTMCSMRVNERGELREAMVYHRTTPWADFQSLQPPSSGIYNVDKSAGVGIRLSLWNDLLVAVHHIEPVDK